MGVENPTSIADDAKAIRRRGDFLNQNADVRIKQVFTSYIIERVSFIF